VEEACREGQNPSRVVVLQKKNKKKNQRIGDYLLLANEEKVYETLRRGLCSS
jgi:hypothetical protein